MKNICFFTGHYDPSRHVIMTFLEKIMPKDASLFLFSAEEIEEKYQFGRTKTFGFKGSKLKVPPVLRKFCKENEIDILSTLTDTPEVALSIIYATTFTKIKTILNFEGSPTFAFKNWSFLFLQFFIDRFLACSKEVSERVKKYLVFRRNNTFYLPNPINTKIFSPGDRKSARKNTHLAEYKKIILYVGRMEYNQGSDYLLKLVKNNPNIYFLFIGKILDENFNNLNLKNLKLIPFIENKKIPDYYRAADLSIFLCRRTSYPFPPRESIACGTPVIVFDIEAFKSVPENIMIKSPLDIKEIQKKINDFFSLSEDKKEKLRREGREFIIEDSSEEKIKDKTIKYLLKF